MVPPPQVPDGPVEDIDSLVIGCGITGLNTAYRFREAFPNKEIVIFEARPIIGGTWTFFKYPGLRCDSSMLAYGFPWHPWTESEAVVSGDRIAAYIQDAAETSGLLSHVRFGHKVVGANWNSEIQTWDVDVEVTAFENGDEHRPLGPPTRSQVHTKFMLLTAGYYSYTQALDAKIPGIDDFGGTVVHPQWWPKSLDTTGRKIALVGSGATAVTLLPELAKTAGHITLVQRSPSYILDIKVNIGFNLWARKWLPKTWASQACWARAVFVENAFRLFCLNAPEKAKKFLLNQAREQMGDAFPGEKHFTPRHQPVTQRTCMTPNGDYFKALAQDNATIVTGRIRTVTKTGIEMEDGTFINADLIVTATGLYCQLFNGVVPTVHGKPVVWKDRFAWRGCMLEGVPNMGMMMGYTALTWTTGIDKMAQNVVRVAQHMDQIGATSAMPEVGPERATMYRRPVMVSGSTYVVESRDRVPMSGDKSPWYGRISFPYDWWQSKIMNVTDGMKYQVPSKKDL